MMDFSIDNWETIVPDEANAKMLSRKDAYELLKNNDANGDLAVLTLYIMTGYKWHWRRVLKFVKKKRPSKALLIIAEKALKYCYDGFK